MMAYFVVTSALLAWNTSRTLFVSILGFVTLGLLTTNIDIERLQDFLRFNNGQYELGIRATAWEAIVTNMSYRDWLFGTWLSHWPEFFETHIGYKFSDPHCWIFSALGLFGLMGLLYYAYLARMLWSCMRSGILPRKLVAALLLIMLFLKDLNSVQYLFNYNPISFLIWFCLGLLLLPTSEWHSDDPSVSFPPSFAEGAQ
jgi:hypothetical protein